VFESKLRVKPVNEIMKNGARGACEENIINIHQDIKSNTMMIINKQRRITLAGVKSKRDQSLSEPFIPGPRSLLKPIERFVKLAN
jgi:hypothetical protein